MLQAPPPTTAPPKPQHKTWTREECQTLERLGLVELERYELIEGELIRKMSKKMPHIGALALLIGWLQMTFGIECAMPEPSIDVASEDNPTSYPEPDAVVLTRSFRRITRSIRPEDIRLVVEVADSTLAFDLDDKAGLYARAAISEYWVLDVNGRRLIVHRDPQQGKYGSIVAYDENESLTCLAAPNTPVRVGDLL